jgi:hypothetical protein
MMRPAFLPLASLPAAFRLPVLGGLFAIAATLPAGAAEAGAKPAPVPPLPGVEGGYRIVRPAPQAEPDAPADAGHFRIGDIDVHVSGSIAVDIGVGSIRPRAH